MIFEFRIKCKDEKNNFALTILVDENQTFLDFHNSIYMCSSFETTQMTSFFISDDDWNRRTEITLMEVDDKIPSMEKTKVNELVNNKGDKLLYLFDFFSDRFFIIELVNIIDNDNKKRLPLCIQAVGEAPQQIIIDTELDELLNDEYDSSDDYDDENIGFENIDDLDI